MALGLTTAAMSMVFNKLGIMVSGSPVGVVAMVAILLVGHAINFGLNALGAYVHTLRLQYVELFSKFYEGGGRPFTPFALKGKYIRIKEEK
jgi:V/A-type H+-transporting ATPase subunit I